MAKLEIGDRVSLKKEEPYGAYSRHGAVYVVEHFVNDQVFYLSGSPDIDEFSARVEKFELAAPAPGEYEEILSQQDAFAALKAAEY